MGLRLPIYPYYAAQGKPGVKRNPRSYFNRTALEEMQTFAEYLSEPTIRETAFNIIPPPGARAVPDNGWFEPEVFDEDDEDHAGLAALMAHVGKHGTILVSSLDHIMGKEKKGPPTAATKDLMTRFDIEDIEVLPLVGELKGQVYDLRVYPKRFAGTRRPAPELFELMPEMARATVEYLKRSVAGGNRTRRAPQRQQIVAARR